MSLGIMHLSSSTTLQVDSSDGGAGHGHQRGKSARLGASRTSSPNFKSWCAAGERNRLFLDYFTLDRSRQRHRRATDRVSRFGAADRRPGAVATEPARAHPDLRIFLLAQREARDRRRPSASTAVDISAQAKVQTEARHMNQREDQAGPFPTPGIAATWVVEQAILFRRTRPIP